MGSSALHLHKPKLCTASVVMRDAPPHGRAKFTSTPGVTFRLAMSSGTTPKDFTVQLSWDQLCKVSGESQQRMDAKPVNNGLTYHNYIHNLPIQKRCNHQWKIRHLIPTLDPSCTSLLLPGSHLYLRRTSGCFLYVFVWSI